MATGENRCDINFTVDYQLKSRTLQFVLSGMFDLAVRKVMTAFEERARVLYAARRDLVGHLDRRAHGLHPHARRARCRPAAARA